MCTTKRVLIFSSTDEYYYLKDILREARDKGTLDIVIFDTSLFPKQLQFGLSISATDGDVSGNIDILRLDPDTLVGKQDSVDIRSIGVAWWLRGSLPSAPNDASVEYYIARESAKALLSLMSCNPWRWINNRDEVLRTDSSKALQYRMAQQAGLRIPDTLVGNHVQMIGNFARERGEILLKPLSSPYLRTTEAVFYRCLRLLMQIITLGFIQLESRRDVPLLVYSEVYSYEEIHASHSAIIACPFIAQNYVQKKDEFRVVVMGKHILSCRMDTQASPYEQSRIDFRNYDFTHVRYEAEALPEDVGLSLHRMVHSLGLQYAVIDLVRSPNGEFTMLDVNPSGQWEWIAALAKLPIAETIVLMLEEA